MAREGGVVKHNMEMLQATQRGQMSKDATAVSRSWQGQMQMLDCVLVTFTMCQGKGIKVINVHDKGQMYRSLLWQLQCWPCRGIRQTQGFELREIAQVYFINKYKGYACHEHTQLAE